MKDFCLTAPEDVDESGQPDASNCAAEVYRAIDLVSSSQSWRDMKQNRVRERMRLAKVRQGVMEL